MRVAIGADHAGFHMKEDLRALLERAGVDVEDFGTWSEDPVDYPDIAVAVAGAVSGGRFDRGILICGTGIGMGIASNKVAGIRAGVAHDTESARLARAHNDVNVLTLGARTTPPGWAPAIVETFLSTAFDGGRHQRRVDKITALDRASRT